MTRHLLLLTTGLLATAGSAVAQYPYPYQQQAASPGGGAGPVLSPYLNLLNGTNNAGVNYYNFVRPQLQLQQQQMYGGGGAPLLGEFPLASTLPSTDWTARIPRPSGVLTGNPTAFMNYGPYFNTMGTIGGAQRGQQTAAKAAQPAAPAVPRQ